MTQRSCMEATPEMSAAAMRDLIAACPPGPWPNGWAAWPNVGEAMRSLGDDFANCMLPGRYTYPVDRGIVIAGGGLKYFPSVWVNVRLLRHFGCELPIQLWYLGDEECDPYMKRLIALYGVECVDARNVEVSEPCRILCGWELKPYAALHSPFAEVLFLDADNGVVRNPAYLFDEPRYKTQGAIFWPDYTCWKLKPDVWRIFGIDDMADPEVAIHERAFESGQYLIDKTRCQRELSMALWYAEHSDWTFKHVYGDKECFHVAWRKLGTEYAMPTAGPGWNVHTIVQFDFDGQIVFQHRCQDKWRFGGNRFNASLANEQLCFDFVKELSSLWNGVLWSNPDPTDRERDAMATLAGKRYLYRRVGHDERIVSFESDGSIGRGSDECERRWSVNQHEAGMVLSISRVDRPMCHLRRDGDGVWRGAWLAHERMPIELVPQGA